MDSGKGTDQGLEALLDDALRELEEDAPTVATTATQASPSAVPSSEAGQLQVGIGTDRKSAGAGGLAFDPLKGSKPIPSGTDQGKTPQRKEIDDLCKGLFQLTEEIANCKDPSATAADPGQIGDDGSQEAVSQDASLNATLDALAAATAQASRSPQQGQHIGGSENDPDVNTIVELVMQKMLSKEMLYEPMKEICSKYPGWFENHACKLEPQEVERYKQQHHYIQQIIGVYERDPQNYRELMRLMQEVQSCGQPPQEIIDEVTPGMDFNQGFGEAPPPMEGADALEDCKLQ